MSLQPVFDADLIRRYDRPGPRYTSYPTALQFTDAFGPAQYREAMQLGNASARPLSLYVHIPFCASPCYYCGCTRIITRQPQVASKYLQRLTDEIGMQGRLVDRSRVVEQLHLGGGTPTYFTDEQLEMLMASLAASFTLCRDAHREFSIEMDPRTARPGLLSALGAMGFNRLSLGVQDFDLAVQEAVNRVQSVASVERLINEARHSGFSSVSVDLIYGLPLQTEESFAHTLQQVISLRPDRIAAYSYAHLPERFKAQRKIRPQALPSPESKLQLLGVTVDALSAAGYTYIGMDHFALPQDELSAAQRAGTLHRNFQGYSTRGGLDLVGLGLSAIGKVGDTYAQNYKTLDRYYGALDLGDVPIERGVILSDEDRLRRSVIDSIMCHGVVDMSAIARTYAIDFDRYFTAALARLAPMRDDGLVQIDATRIRVTGKGRLLLRAIAMAFDAYAAEPAQLARHSKVI